MKNKVITFIKTYYVDILIILFAIIGWSLFLSTIFKTIPNTKQERDNFKELYNLAIQDNEKYKGQEEIFKQDIDKLNRFIEDKSDNISLYEKKIADLRYVIYKDRKNINNINNNKIEIPIKKTYTNEELEQRLIKDYFTKSDSINN